MYKEKRVAELIGNALLNDLEMQAMSDEVTTFEQAGLPKAGLILSMDDGCEYYITVTRNTPID